jgi:4-amino-4-deoxy-L-arabinose transferase-like glycosyltransferase
MERPSAKTLLALAAAAFLVRAAFVLLEPSNKLAGDEWTWYRWALSPEGGVASEKVGFSPFRNHMIFYPPLYPYFIAAVHELAGSLTAVKLAQAMLGAALAVVVACLGAAVFDRRVGLLAGLFVAWSPDVIWFAAHFWSETLFLAFIWWAMERVFAADREERLGVAVFAGVLWGLAILTRETALYFIVVVAAWLAWKRGAGGRRRAAAFAVCALITVAPWTYRNWRVFDAFIPVSTAGGQNLFQGNANIERDTTYVMVDDVRGRVEQYRYAMRMGVQAIWERQPTWIFEKLYEQMPNFWEADNLAVIHVKRGADTPPGGYGPTRVSTAWMVAAVTVIPYLVVLAGFVLGLRDLPLTRDTAFLLLFLLYYNSIHIVTHGFARYRLPVMPVVFLFAAWGFYAPRDARVTSRARRWVAALVAIVLVLCLIPGLRKTVEHPAFGGAGRAEDGDARP